MATADKLTTVAENVPKVYHAGQMNVVENAECLKGSESGSALLIDDVSPVTHEMGVKVRGKNLLSNLNYLLPVNISTETGYSEKVYLKSGLSYTFSIASISGATSWRLMAHIYENGTIVSAGADSILNGYDWFTGNLNIYCPKNANYFMNQSNLTVLENITFNITALKDCAISFGIYLGDTSTETICNNAQLELGTTATAYTPYVPDLTAVTVSKYGKNLFDYDNATKVSGFVSTFTKQDGKIIVGQSKVGTYKSSNVSLSTSLVGKTITITAQASTSGVNVAQLRVQWGNARGVVTGDRLLSNTYTGETDTLLTLSGVVPEQPDSAYPYLVLMFYSNSNGALEEGVTYTATYSNIQLELGTTATDYEPYDSKTNYTSTSDGTVNGVTSLYPNTTLITDADGVIIDCDYYKDIDKAFNELTTSVALSGGE